MSVEEPVAPETNYCMARLSELLLTTDGSSCDLIPFKDLRRSESTDGFPSWIKFIQLAEYLAHHPHVRVKIDYNKVKALLQRKKRLGTIATVFLEGKGKWLEMELYTHEGRHAHPIIYLSSKLFAVGEVDPFLNTSILQITGEQEIRFPI